jgi:sugar (pentulose or hexulose) kinase
MMGVGGASLAEAAPRPPVRETVEPDSALAERLAPKLEQFRAAYPAIKNAVRG